MTMIKKMNLLFSLLVNPGDTLNHRLCINVCCKFQHLSKSSITIDTHIFKQDAWITVAEFTNLPSRRFDILLS